MKPLRVLIVEDEVSLRYTLKEVLVQEGHVVETAGDGFEALAALETFQPQIVVCDYSMPRMNGIEVLRKIREKSPDVFVIMMTAYGTEEIAVEAMKSGAFDYFAKPFNNEEMVLRIAAAGERLSLTQENRELRRTVDALTGTPQLIWRSPLMAGVDAIIGQIAPTDVTVLVQGESGTGKELVASSIHRRSARAGGAFVKLNCAALPEPLIESELFGYDAGAFTGAVGRRKGKFEQAQGGTIFLDEIGDMTLSTQTKVLRVLQEREIERLGGQRTIRVDVRVVAATHQDLEAKIAAGEFREDLFYRLNVVRIRIPALRERLEDLELLASHFLEVYARRFGKEHRPIPDSVFAGMLAYRWPGNVRELENAIARAVVLDDYARMVPGKDGPPAEGGGMLPDDIFGLPYRDAKARLLELFERRYLTGCLEQEGGNVSRAAKRAGMHRKNFWEKLQRYQPGAAEPPDDDGDGDDGDPDVEEGDE